MGIRGRTIIVALVISLWGVNSSWAVDYFSIPTASIVIDGNLDDWNSVPAANMDLTNDICGPAYVDIGGVYMAQDAEHYYFRMDMSDNLTLNLFPMDDTSWQAMPSGTWYWTVLGYSNLGQQTPSDFTIFDFTVQ